MAESGIPTDNLGKEKVVPRTPVDAKRILIVDDDELVRESIALLLKSKGYLAETSKNGFDALERLDERHFGLVICDIRMPGITGIDAVRAMRLTCRLDENRNIPVIFITGYYEDGLDQHNNTLGLLECIYKPFDDSQILELLKIHLGT